ncbi:MAG: NAD(P)-dependent oxidoreductase [Candidatus Thiodiazotropha sp. (ex Notomyrtea botanica)]|nr:NAD(P)-dependent oxidoreductase [Candidatus Thiodiazotropha sp. (ex Notomyrtea botanica)]
MAERNVLITGGNGYIGSRFLQCLIKEPLISVTSVARGNALKKDNRKHYTTVYSDLNNNENYLSELNEAEYIVWFAANRKHFLQYNSLYDDNVHPIVRVLPALKKSINLKVFIYISSISAIDNLPYSGSPISTERAPHPATSYGLTKLLAEKHVRKSGIPFITLRLPFMYGSEFKAFRIFGFGKKWRIHRY